jgi:hypothetical protein
MFERLRLGLLALALLVVSACSGPSEIKSVKDFDKAPCLLLSDDAMNNLIKEPYADLTGVEPTLVGSKSASSQGTVACVYSFEAKNTTIPQLREFTVTVAHSDDGNRPLAICVAGAYSNAGGYKIQKIGDQSCTSPSSDLWLKIGTHYFHVVVVPQPGFTDPIDASFALSPMILAVGTATADRMPKT